MQVLLLETQLQEQADAQHQADEQVQDARMEAAKLRVELAKMRAELHRSQIALQAAKENAEAAVPTTPVGRRPPPLQLPGEAGGPRESSEVGHRTACAWCQ